MAYIVFVFGLPDRRGVGVHRLCDYRLDHRRIEKSIDLNSDGNLLGRLLFGGLLWDRRVWLWFIQVTLGDSPLVIQVGR